MERTLYNVIDLSTGKLIAEKITFADGYSRGWFPKHSGGLDAWGRIWNGLHIIPVESIHHIDAEILYKERSGVKVPKIVRQWAHEYLRADSIWTLDALLDWYTIQKCFGRL